MLIVYMVMICVSICLKVILNGISKNGQLINLCLDNKGKKGYLFDIHFIIKKKCTICIMDTLLHPITNQLQTICSIHGCNKDIKSPKLKN